MQDFDFLQIDYAIDEEDSRWINIKKLNFNENLNWHKFPEDCRYNSYIHFHSNEIAIAMYTEDDAHTCMYIEEGKDVNIVLFDEFKKVLNEQSEEIRKVAFNLNDR